MNKQRGAQRQRGLDGATQAKILKIGSLHPKEGWVGAEQRGIFIKTFLSCLEGVLILLRNSGTLRKMSFYSGILNVKFFDCGESQVGRSMSIALHRVPTLTSLATL